MTDVIKAYEKDTYPKAIKAGNAKRFEEMLKLLRKGAELGSSKAQSQLAYLYFHGLVVYNNFDKAREYLERASKNGHKGAKEFLAGFEDRKKELIRNTLSKDPPYAKDYDVRLEGQVVLRPYGMISWNFGLE